MLEADLEVILAGCRRPDRYTAFLDAPGTPPGGAPAPALDGVAAALAAALREDADGPPTTVAADRTPADPAPPDRDADRPGLDRGGRGEADRSRARQPILGAPATLESPDPAIDGARYSARSADLVLGGGLGTALTAPLAVCALAEHYVFRRIAGSSAAAVTAAAAAAAELGRTAGGDASGSGACDPAVSPGFAGLADVVAWLSAGDPEGSAESWRLARLFRPADDAADLHRLATALLRPPDRGADLGPDPEPDRRPWTARRNRGRADRWVRAGAAVLAGLDRTSRTVLGILWAGAIIGWGGILLALARSPQVSGVLLPFVAVPLAVTFALAAAFGSAWIGVHTLRAAVRRALTTDGWGLIGDTAGPVPHHSRPGRLDRLAGVLVAGDVPPLQDWIADRIDDLAGVPTTGHADRYALTFGDLWLGRLGRRTGDDVRFLRRAAVRPALRVVDLTLLTTDLSGGRPYLLPFGTADRPAEVPSGDLLFCRACLLRVLPARVVDQMVLLAPGSGPACPRHDEPLHHLPEPWDQPVAFAVRLATATPGLLRTVPLYRTPAGTARPHWFCDGAAVGALPAHTFDTLLPRWPTFSLRTCPAGPADGSDPVVVPEQDATDRPAPWRPVTGAAGLAAALVAAVGGWRDLLRVEAPGLRGRQAVVHVPAGAIGAGPFLTRSDLLQLAGSGHLAGATLRERFTAPDGGDPAHSGTDRYRWVRMRLALSQLRQISLSVGGQVPLYTDLALKYRVPKEVTPWFSPPLDPGAADPAWGDAVAALTHLRSLASGGVLDWDTDWGAPPPDPHLRLG